MRKSRFSEEHIVGVLKEAEAGVPVGELCRRLGVTDATVYHWKAKYGGLEVNEARQLEEEDRRLKVAAATGRADAGPQGTEGGARKKALKPAASRARSRPPWWVASWPG